MRRYLPGSNGTLRRTSVIESEKNLLETDSAEQSTVASTIQEPLPAPNLKVKRLDYYYSKWSRKWKYQNSGSNVIPELRPLPADGKEDPWASFCFVVIRTLPQQEDKEIITFKVVIKSPYLLKACKDVIQEIAGLSWNSILLELDPQLLLTFLPSFEAYTKDLRATTNLSKEDGYVMASVDVLIEYLRRDYRQTIASIENMTSHGEITFDLLYAVMVPRSTVITHCPVTGEIRALQLVSITKVATPSGFLYTLICEGIDADDSDDSSSTGFYRTQSRIILPDFEGTVKINSLDAYPIQYHPQETELRRSLVARGLKWSKLTGVHHMSYKGTAGFRCQGKVIKYNLNSRVMIDRSNFKRLNPNYSFPMRKPEVANINSDGWGEPPAADAMFAHIPLQVENRTQREIPELTEQELLITSPVLMGFSLSDKLWLELNVEKVHSIEWNEEAFANLVLPADRKMLLQSLVEAHNEELSGFDDFIKGKGRGLVVNLFGPPGVGKTLSAEATSEHVKRPLYVVGAADLGTKAAELDQELQRVFELATTWKAIVLIDEADVFLEQRSLHDLERNAMVACFLRHLEYYPAILFMTTNRVKTFDEAFLSRIHIALHFRSLPVTARTQVWTAFLKKAGVEIGVKDDHGITEDELMQLAERDINGRQVKNATRTANSLASSRGERLRFKHIVEVLDVMEDFTAEFKSMTSGQ